MTETGRASISVRSLAGFAYPGGSIQTQSRVRRREREGQRVHQQVQSARPEGYQTEVSVEHLHETEDIELLIRGRIDGLYSLDGIDIIEEIKSTYLTEGDLQPMDIHLAQAKMYAAMHVMNTGVDQIRVHLTYVHVTSGEEFVFDYLFAPDELSRFYSELVDGYIEELRAIIRWRNSRDTSIAAAPFPYDKPREGQNQFSEAVTDAIDNEEKLFVRAPTGIGKTAAALFPALKAIASGKGGPIFYLSARTTAQTNAEECLTRIRDADALIRSVTLTAKAKICFLGLEICEPDGCPFAEGYYDRLPAASRAVRDGGGGAYTREAVEALAREFILCPYELSLDIALRADVIICDYNYVFDPMVYLRRFFLEGNPGSYLLLIDEAHNLVDRAMDMYSASIHKKSILASTRVIEADEFSSLQTALKSINKYFIALKKTMKEERLSFWVAEEIEEELVDYAEKALELLPEYFSGLRGDPIPPEISLIYRSLLQFSVINAIKGDGHKVFAEVRGGDVSVTVRCIDPSTPLRDRTDRCRSSVFFSATLTPFEYFAGLLDGGDEVRHLSLESPFPKENLSVFIDPKISTRYRDRDRSLKPLAEYVELFSRRGNCIFFFPSYAYLEMTLEVVRKEKPDIEVLVQERGMDDLGRRDFLESFAADHPDGVLAFAVLGGVFGEGIDLVGERLVSAVIVGVGLPPIGDERNLMKAYYDEKFGKGFLFAYNYPGMNRVLQAAGRVIRSGEDTGTVLFIGQRFGTAGYKRLFTPEYDHAVSVTAIDQVAKSLPGE